MNQPQVTILMPVYNAAPYLREAIDSILNQTFKDFEFVIINDGSTDSSEEIISSYNDKRIKYFKNESNLKLIATLNKGFDLATGKYIARMDADDISLPDRLQLQSELMEQNPDIGLCGTWFENFTEEKTTGQARYAPDHETICFTHLYQIHLSHGTCMFRTSVLRQHKLYFNPDFSHAEDYELWSRISAVTRLANIQQVLYRVRHHKDEVSIKYSDVQALNSSRVKKNLFAKLGLVMNDDELNLLQSLAHFKYGNNADYLQAVRNLLEKMMLAKNHEMFFSAPFYQNKIAGFWLNANYNLTGSLGMGAYKNYFASRLSVLEPPHFSTRVKFMLKAMLKK